ncbi:SPT2 protein, partial [Penelope pileata]|nr:SPT2 protein [Penelope pileata]
SLQKRYSLAVGPPKKVPKVKGVESAAVQAFLRRKEEEKRKKELEEKRKKEQLLAKRIELKHDRKARAMASRTKDNFYGYNGIPVEEKSKKRRTCENVSQAPEAEYSTENETEQLEFAQTESECEQEEYDEKPSKAAVKPKAPPKSAPAPLNFTDLLRLAEKKQYEPVEIKVVKKIEERPRTAEELREREYLERKNKRVEMQKKRSEKEVKNTGMSSSSKKASSLKECVNAKLSKSSVDKHSFPKGSLSSVGGTDKKSKAPALTEKHSRSSSSSRPSQMQKVKTSQNSSFKSSTGSGQSKLPVNGIGKSGTSQTMPSSKPAANGAQRLPSAKESSLKRPAHMKLGNAAALQHEMNSNAKRSGSSLGKGGPGHPGGGSSAGPGQSSSNSGVGPGRPGNGSSPGPGRLGNSSAVGPGRPSGSSSTGPGRLGSGSGMGPGRPGGSSSTGLGRPGSSSGTGLGRQGSSSGTGPGRPGHSTNAGPGRLGSGMGTGPGRPGQSASAGPGRPGNSLGTGPGRPGVSPSSGPGRPGSSLSTAVKPKCTVVSETISSKNLVTRPSNGQINGVRSLPGHRPVFRSPGMGRPPISYKRQIDDDEDDEYDSEMDDFIEDEGEPQEEISKHIREIFGYDRKRYKDESDYALRYMESSWREQQKEEARSLRLGVQEDLEELRREEEELKRKRQSKKLRTR